MTDTWELRAAFGERHAALSARRFYTYVTEEWDGEYEKAFLYHDADVRRVVVTVTVGMIDYAARLIMYGLIHTHPDEIELKRMPEL